MSKLLEMINEQKELITELEREMKFAKVMVAHKVEDYEYLSKRIVEDISDYKAGDKLGLGLVYIENKIKMLNYAMQERKKYSDEAHELQIRINAEREKLKRLRFDYNEANTRIPDVVDIYMTITDRGSIKGELI